MIFASPRQAPKYVPLTEHAIRAMIARKECPGFYVGSHFKVDCDALNERIKKQSAANGGMTAADAPHEVTA